MKLQSFATKQPVPPPLPDGRLVCVKAWFIARAEGVAVYSGLIQVFVRASKLREWCEASAGTILAHNDYCCLYAYGSNAILLNYLEDL